jgi:hypothetical protein
MIKVIKTPQADIDKLVEEFILIQKKVSILSRRKRDLVEFKISMFLRDGRVTQHQLNPHNHDS